MQNTSFDLFNDGSVILCLDIKRLIINKRLTLEIRRIINDFMSCRFELDDAEYETVFCQIGRDCFDFKNGWCFMDGDSVDSSEMKSDEFGIWWDLKALKNFVKTLEVS